MQHTTHPAEQLGRMVAWGLLKGLHHGEVRILLYIAGHGGQLRGVSQLEAAGHLGCSKDYMSRTCRGLERRGLLSIERPPARGRQGFETLRYTLHLEGL